MSVGIVLVSHSPQLAQATYELGMQMVADCSVSVEIAAGNSEGSFGTDAMAIMTAIETAQNGDGVVILTDLGSAILATDMALEFLGYPEDVVMVPAPFVEGFMSAIVAASTGNGLAEVVRQARSALDAKRNHIDGALGINEEQPADTSHTPLQQDALSRQVKIMNTTGIHARPAAQLVQLASQYQANISLVFDGETVSATSLMDVAGLGTQGGDEIELRAQGEQAEEALSALAELIESGFGES